MTFSNLDAWIFIAVSLIVLVPLAWFAWRNSGPSARQSRWLAVALRITGIILVAFAIADPQRVSERPITGANVVAVLADDSMGLRIKDNNAILDRGESMRKRLSGTDSGWLEDLGATYQVRNYRLEQGLHRIASFDSLTFEGQQSNINSALIESERRLSQIPTAGILLLTDGNGTDPELSDDQLATLPPVFPIIVGEQRPVPDLSIESLDLQQTAFGDTPLKLDIDLSRTGLANQDIRTQLRRLNTQPKNSQLLGSGSLINEQLTSLEDSSRIEFSWNSKEGGIQFYEVITELVLESDLEQTDEATLANNKRMVVVDTGKDRYRVLYVTGRPNWEFKFLNRALAEDPQLDVVGLIRIASREPNFEFKGRAGENSNSLYRGFGREDETERYDESVIIRMNTRDELELRTGFPSLASELFAYDAIVIDDLEADFFSFNQQTLIRDFVKQRGGGLLVLGGVNAFSDGGYQGSPIAEALPIYLDNYGPSAPLDRAVQWNLTRDGWVAPWIRIRPVESQERLRMQEMPLLRVYNSLQRIKPGATTLATIVDPGAESYPALVTRNFGSGRVATLAVGDLWRWGMQDAGSQADLAQFWRQISRWLVKDNLRRIELTAKQTTEGTVLTAYARDPDFRPLQMGTVKVYITQISQEGNATQNPVQLELSMKPVSNKSGQYETSIPLNDGGAYHARAIVTNADGTVAGEAETGWVLQPLVSEFASLSPNRAYLEKIAARTGGKVLEMNQLDQLISELKAIPSPLVESFSQPLWHKNWLFLLALGAFLAEWLLRRKRGLA